jgi:DnaJ-class molecular chaperone
MTTTEFYNCPKCDGHGQIRAFSNVAGGVCFKCNGNGKLAGKKPVSAQRWAFCADGSVIVWKKAKTEAAALRAAKAFFDGNPNFAEAEISVRRA